MEYQEGTIRKCRTCNAVICYNTMFANHFEDAWVDDLNGGNDKFHGWRYCYKGTTKTPHKPLEVVEILAKYEM